MQAIGRKMCCLVGKLFEFLFNLVHLEVMATKSSFSRAKNETLSLSVYYVSNFLIYGSLIIGHLQAQLKLKCSITHNDIYNLIFLVVMEIFRIERSDGRSTVQARVESVGVKCV